MIVDWRDADRVAFLLIRAYPEIDPGTLEFSELSQMVLDLPEGGGRNEPLDEEALEAIRKAWSEEYERDGI